MSERIEVEALFEADGTIEPRAFVWRDTRYPITFLGRQREADGERRFLVMTAGDRVFELAFLRTEGTWRLRRTPEDFRSQKGAA